MGGKRRSIRYRGYDYRRPGFYFVTICTFQKEHSLGKVTNSQFVPSAYGKIALKYWFLLPRLFPHIETDAFNMMPNHLHAIIKIQEAIPLENLPLSERRQKEQHRARFQRSFRITKHSLRDKSISYASVRESDSGSEITMSESFGQSLT